MPKRIFITLLAGVFALAALVWWSMGRSHEPVYQNKPLSAWLKEMEKWSGDTNSSAYVAFREMGTNAIPALLRVLESGGPAYKQTILKFNQKQSLVGLPFGTPWHETGAAGWALYAMGTNACPAIPALTNLLFHSNQVIVCTKVLAGAGTEGLPALVGLLTNLDFRFRHAATSGLGWARSDSDTIVPLLIARLRDSDRLVRIAAAQSLGHLHSEPELAVPALTNTYFLNDPALSTSVLISLGMFESNAVDAMPMILQALESPDQLVRQSASFALRQIKPDDAQRRGMK